MTKTRKIMAAVWVGLFCATPAWALTIPDGALYHRPEVRRVEVEP